MMAKALFLVFVAMRLPFVFAQDSQGQNTSTPVILPTEDDVKCERVKDVPICEDMPWNYTLFPNLRNHDSHVDANGELEQFRQLIEVNCSGAIVHFLCAIYTPFCTNDHPLRVLRPCKRLCQHVRDGCEPVFNRFAGGLPWPDHLNCDNYDDSDLCFGPGADELDDLTIPTTLVSATSSTPPDASTSSTDASTTAQNTSKPMQPTVPQTTPEPPTSSITSGSPPSQCPQNMNVTPNLQGKRFSFGGVSNCGPPCSGIYFTNSQRNTIAPLFILIFALVCIVFTLFTVATFFINRNRFHYPERPIVYLSLCYLVLSVAYFIGAISKLVGGGDASFGCTVAYNPTEIRQSSRFVFQSLPNDNVNMSTASCVILFLLAYYTQMAASLWWVILTFTWFLAAVIKWGEEGVARLWPLYHVITWILPAVQAILVLALQMVDGDQLSGLCYPGQYSRVALGVFVFLPLLVYLLFGCVFLVIGFLALVNIRREVERDPIKSRKLCRLIIRIGVYAALYIIPNTVLLFIHIYELAEHGQWEESYIGNSSCRTEGNQSQCPSSPSFAAFLIRYIALFFVGIGSSSWVFSKKTFNTWTKFCRSCKSAQHNKVSFDEKQVYGLPEKDPKQLQTAV